MHQPAVLLVTHDVDEAIELADRVVVLDEGRIIADIEALPEHGNARVTRFAGVRTELLGYLGVSTTGEEAQAQRTDRLTRVTS